MIGKLIRRGVVASCMSAIIASAPAQATILVQSAAGWRLQDYNDGNVTVWFSSSTCGMGKLVLLGSFASTEVKNRFWSAVATAKATGRTIGVDYSPSDCAIQSFWL